MGRLLLKTPLYLLTSSEPCYRCGATAAVVALACKEFQDADDDPAELVGPASEPVLIQSVTEMPDFTSQAHTGRASALRETSVPHGRFRLLHERLPTVQRPLRRLFLFAEPEGAFFP